MEKEEKNYTNVKVSFAILFDDEELAFFEKYRKMAAEKGLNQSFEEFISGLLSIGSIHHLKRQAAFYIGGEIID